MPKFSTDFVGGVVSGPMCVKGVTCKYEHARGGAKAHGRARMIRRSSFPICRKVRRTVVTRRS